MPILERYHAEMIRILEDDNFRNKWFKDNMYSFEQYPWPPVAILPDVAKRREVGLHHTSVEVMGLFHAGKSSLLQHVDTSLGDTAKIFTEFEVKGRDLKAETGNLADAGGFAEANGILEMVKILQFEGVNTWIVEKALEFARAQRQVENKIIINERGVHDIFPFLYWLTSLSRQPSVIGNQLRAETIQTLFHSALARSFTSDAVVLYGVSRETNKERRINMGKNPNGRMANDTYWPIMERGYSWWLGSIYPYVRERFGTGLLVVDGEQPLKENNQRVLEYLQDIHALKHTT